VGHAEPDAEVFRDFRAVSGPGVTLYQRGGASSPACEPAFQPVWGAPIPAAAESRQECRLASRTACPTWPETPVPKPGEETTLARVRELADCGDWDGAVAGCREILASDGLDPAVHYYYALVLEQLGRLDQAEASLRRALYLDRTAVLTHYHLGLLLQKKDPRQAMRSFQNVLDLLSRERPADALALADGMTAADLEEMTRMHLEVLHD